MKKSLFVLLCAGSFAIVSCNKAEKKEPETVTTTTTTTEPVETPTPEEEAMYRTRAEESANKIAADLKMESDTAMCARVKEVCYKRAKKVGHVHKKHVTDTTGMYMEMRDVSMETNKEMQEILPPEQYQTYEVSTTTYYGGMTDTMATTPTEPAKPIEKIKTKTKGDETVTKVKNTDKTKTKTITDKEGNVKTK